MIYPMSEPLIMPPPLTGPPPSVFTVPLQENFFPRLLHTSIRRHPLQVPGHRSEHTHDVYHVVLVTGGTGSFLRDGAIIPTRRGHLHLVSPGQPHSFDVRLKDTVEYCEVTTQFVSARGRVLTLPIRQLLEHWSGLPCGVVDESEQVSPELYALIVGETGHIAQACGSTSADAHLRINRSMSELFHGLLTDWFRRDAVEPAATPLEIAYRHIQAHYHEPVTLAHLAQLTHLSENYLSRAFKARYGVTPIYHQHRLRVQAAKRMLETTHYPLKKIAEMTGFCDEHYLSRIFRKYESMPPIRYRQEAGRASRVVT